MAGEGGERLYWMHFEVEKDGAHVVPAPVLVESVASIQRVVYLLAKFTRGEELGQRASFSRELREAFALQCRVPQPGSYAMPFEIGSAAHSPLVAGEADDVGRLFRGVTAAVGGGDVDGVRELVPDLRYLDCLGRAYRKATPPSRSGVSYWIEDHRRRRILDSRKSEATLDDLGGHTGRKRRVREDTISGMLVGMNFDERSIRLTRPDGKSVSAYYDEESERPLIEHRRGWVELTGDVLYDADDELGMQPRHRRVGKHDIRLGAAADDVRCGRVARVVHSRPSLPSRPRLERAAAGLVTDDLYHMQRWDSLHAFARSAVPRPAAWTRPSGRFGTGIAACTMVRAIAAFDVPVSPAIGLAAPNREANGRERYRWCFSCPSSRLVPSGAGADPTVRDRRLDASPAGCTTIRRTPMRGKRDRRTGEIIEVASQPLKQLDPGGRPAGRSGRGAASPTEPVTGPLPQVPRPRDARGQAEASTVPEPAMRRSRPARGPAESTFDGKTEPLKPPRGRRARESEEPTRPYRPGSNPTMPAVEASGLGDPMQDPLSGWLVVVRGPGKGRSCPLGYGVNTLGAGSIRGSGSTSVTRRSRARFTRRWTYDPRVAGTTSSTAAGSN